MTERFCSAATLECLGHNYPAHPTTIYQTHATVNCFRNVPRGSMMVVIYRWLFIICLHAMTESRTPTITCSPLSPWQTSHTLSSPTSTHCESHAMGSRPRIGSRPRVKSFPMCLPTAVVMYGTSTIVRAAVKTHKKASGGLFVFHWWLWCLARVESARRRHALARYGDIRRRPFGH